MNQLHNFMLFNVSHGYILREFTGKVHPRTGHKGPEVE